MQSDESEYKVYPARFLILFSFCLATFTQCLVWITFSPIVAEAGEYYSIDASTVDLLLNWGPIIFIPVTFPMMWIAQQQNGLRWTVLIGTGLLFAASTVRLVPSIFPTVFIAKRGGNKVAGLVFVHAAHILNAAAGPFMMSPVSQLSQTWFADSERTTATAFAALANNFGAAIGFVLGPALVPRGSRVPVLLYLHAALSTFALLLVLVYFPGEPRTPPSKAAHLDRAKHLLARRRALSAGDSRPSVSGRREPLLTTTGESGIGDWSGSAKKALSIREQAIGFASNVPFLLLAISGGCVNGVFNGWSGLLDVILRPLDYSTTAAGWFGFSSTIAAIIGGLALGQLSDRVFQRKFKALLLTLLLLCTLSYVWFTASLPSTLWGGDSGKPPLPSTPGTIMAAITLAGLFLGAALPIFYELVVEITYPLPESTSVGCLTFFNNVGACIFLAIPPSSHSIMNVVMTLMVAVTFCCVLASKEEYKRLDAESKQAPTTMTTEPL